MREIKFRGRNYDGIWMYGYLIPTPKPQIHLDNKHCVCACPQVMSKVDKVHYEIEENTIGQYTGLKDKNGKEIYEGDILTWSRNGIESSPLVIEYKHGAFGYTYSEGSFIALAGNSNFAFNPFNNDKRFQIIGNIHDNPELIKGEEK